MIDPPNGLYWPSAGRPGNAPLFASGKDPKAGDLIPDSGGLRRIRVGLEGRGKRGGARVIYYFFDRNHPIYLLDVLAGNERSDLSASERRRLRGRRS